MNLHLDFQVKLRQTIAGMPEMASVPQKRHVTLSDTAGCSSKILRSLFSLEAHASSRVDKCKE